MEVSEERLRVLLRDAIRAGADQAVEKLMQEHPKVERALVGESMLQVRRTRLMTAMLNKLGATAQDRNTSQIMRDALVLGLGEAESIPGKGAVVPNSRVNVRVGNELLRRAKESEASITDLFLFGLFCMALRPENEDITEEKL